MPRWMLLMGIIAATGWSAEPAKPSEFYIVADTWTDYAPFGFVHVLDVRQDGADTVIRYLHIRSVYPCVTKTIVQAVEVRKPNISPAQLVNGANPCAVQPGALDSVRKKYPRKAGGLFESTRFGVVAQCGASSVVLALPMSASVNLKRLQRDHPPIARLWDLYSEIVKSAFGSGNSFYDREQEIDLSLQPAGERLVPQLRSGRYDAGLAAAETADGDGRGASTFTSMLKDYRGPLNPAEASGRPVPQLLHAEAYRFSNFVTPMYPSLAASARIQGKVELQLTAEPVTGEVRSVSALSGHPLLTPAALETAKQWRFEPNSISAETLTVTLNFALCE